MRENAFLTFILLLSLHLSLGAQNAEAFSSVDKDSIMIGDHFNYEMGINLPGGFQVIWPHLNDTISNNIEIIESKDVDTSYLENVLILKKQYKLTSFDSGYFEIPSYALKFKHENDSIVFETNTLSHYIQVFAPIVDTSQAFKAIKGPMSEPYTLREALPWIFLGLSILVLTLLIIWFIRRRKKKKPLFITRLKPELPAHVIAFRMLEELKHEKVWQAGRLKEYHTKLTDIIREYIENRFLIDALEMTTDEILNELKLKTVNEEACKKLKSVLQMSDLVKFAKAKPTPLENDLCLNYCVDFVDETKQETVLRVDENSKNKFETEGKG
jgi:hypothetical protein